MPLTSIAKNKREVVMAASLLGIVVVLGGWELYGAMSGPSPRAPLPSRNPAAQQHTRTSPRSEGLGRPQFHLRIGELAQSEGLDYGTGGRDVFSIAAPPAIEQPVASARPAPEPVTPPPPATPVVPPIDVKYLGYAESAPGTMSALFMRGDDIFMAKSGEIMFHRFRVGAIRAASVQVTDLTDNHTQAISAATTN